MSFREIVAENHGFLFPLHQAVCLSLVFVAAVYDRRSVLTERRYSKLGHYPQGGQGCDIKTLPPPASAAGESG